MNKVKKYYIDRLVLDIDKFEIQDQDKIGLVGVNGAGKTTLIKVLTGEIEIDEGNIELTRVQLQWGVLEFEKGNLGLATHHFQRALSQSLDLRIKAHAYIQLARVYLSKYRTNFSDFLYDEINYNISQALEIAQNPLILPLYVEISIIQSTLAEIQMDFNRATEILNKALELANDKPEFSIFQQRIQTQLQTLKTRNKKFLELILLAEEEQRFEDTEITQAEASAYLEEILRNIFSSRQRK